MTKKPAKPSRIEEALKWADQPLDRCIKRDLPALKAFHVLARAYRMAVRDTERINHLQKLAEEGCPGGFFVVLYDGGVCVEDKGGKPDDYDGESSPSIRAAIDSAMKKSKEKR